MVRRHAIYAREVKQLIWLLQGVCALFTSGSVKSVKIIEHFFLVLHAVQ